MRPRRSPHPDRRLTLRTYQHPNDFIAVRDFLVATYSHYRRTYNWTLERWNFSVSLARIINGTSLAAWVDQIAMWEDGEALLGVVNWEGEGHGEAFFQLAHEELPDGILQEMFDFCEARMGKSAGDHREIYLRIPPDDARRVSIAQARGFVREPWDVNEGILTLTGQIPVVLSAGFTFADGRQVSAEAKAMAHAKAFDYYDEMLYRERAIIGFAEMMLTPDYLPHFDLHVRTPHGEIAAFATLWYDERNQLGILEPVGTVPEFRKLGLGRALIAELINRAREAGTQRVNVGSDQVFYQRLGFEPRTVYEIWRKDVAR